MDIVVVRIIYLEKEEEELDLQITGDAHKTLASFCNWQTTINPKDTKNPTHHDIAILITRCVVVSIEISKILKCFRYDLCDPSTSASCAMLGLAYVGTPCTKDKQCSVNEDGGLKLGLTIAHELGHMYAMHFVILIDNCLIFLSMGCAHDTEKVSGCKASAEDGTYNVMSPIIDLNTRQWSTCSKEFITNIFE